MLLMVKHRRMILSAHIADMLMVNGGSSGNIALILIFAERVAFQKRTEKRDF
jgi:hypothetical protein